LLNKSCLVKFQIGEVLGRQNLIGYDLHEIFTALKYVESTRNNNAFFRLVSDTPQNIPLRVYTPHFKRSSLSINGIKERVHFLP
jgi:hypothetical protein